MKKLTDLTVAEDKIEELRAFYTDYSNSNGKGLRSDLVSHYGFIGCLQWIFTPESVVDLSLLSDVNNKTWSVIINVEIVHYLEKAGVDPKSIKFYADCMWRAKWALHVGRLNPANIFLLPSNKKDLKKFIKKSKNTSDYVILNAPFRQVKAFKAFSETIAREKVMMISGSRDYQDLSLFKNVECYKYLGECFPTAQVSASLVIINPNGPSKLDVIDSNGTVHTVAPEPATAPGASIDDWLFATNVISMDLPGYVDATRGAFDREDSIIVPDGIPMLFSAGESGKDWNDENRGTDVDRLCKENTKFCWATLSETQKPDMQGLGIHKVVVTHAANRIGHLGNPKYAGPEWACGTNIWYLPCKDEKDAQDCIAYLNHPDVVKLVRGIKSLTSSNNKSAWAKIPHHKFANRWIADYKSTD